jgi:Tol biopolymer transport system component
VEQGVPTWSADGTRLVFGERRLARPDSDMELHVVDLASKRVSSVPDSRGTWTARWSPDGRFIVATSVDFHRLLLFDCRANAWQPLVSFHIIDDPSWSADSRDIYFYADGQMNAPDLVLDKPALYRMSRDGGRPEMMVISGNSIEARFHAMA